MELEQAHRLIHEAISRKDLLMVIGECYVQYQGRAASKLPKGKRLLLIKGDSSFAIHQNRLLRPTNYMMNARIAAELKDGALLLSARKLKPKEAIDVKLYSVEGLHSYPMQENADLRLFGSERELSNELMQDLSFLEAGLNPLNQEEVFRKGIVDILAQDSKGRLVVIEVKRRQADYKAVMQLQRYMQQVAHMKGRETRGLLVAPSIGKNAYELLQRNGLEFFNFEFEISNPKSKIKGIQKKQATLDKFSGDS
ncbi:MAG: endonuclease NucS [Candidatus Diapherotrites archaeon]|uniref:Endonuclease NucS n=1 Tax=Candidatus Iainarchaeum sp. TaxID=3101447 RepID=A0A939C9X9_9ARCH|nr:endonuclease NucS [Candidatus Diapherotrites archaeon]